MKDLAYELGIG